MHMIRSWINQSNLSITKTKILTLFNFHTLKITILPPSNKKGREKK